MRLLVAAWLAACASHAATQSVPSAGWTLTGRCVAAESGEPLAGCRVTLTGHQATGFPLHWAWLDWWDPEPVVTGPDGRFSFAVPAQPTPALADGYPSRIHFTVREGSRVGWFGMVGFGEFADMPAQDAGDLPLPRGVRPRFRIADQEGKPVRGVVFHLRREDPAPARSKSLWLEQHVYLRSGNDGGVTLLQPLLPGRYKVLVDDEAPIGAEHLDVRPDHADTDEPITFTVKTRPVLAGIVVDQDGKPVGGYELSAQYGAAPSTVHASVRTDPNGVFAFTAKSPAAENVELRHRRDRAGMRGERMFGSFAWGRDDVRLEVARGGSIDLRVTGRDGKPLTDLSVHVVPAVESGSGGDPVRLASTFAEGVVRIRDLSPEPHALLVHARGGRFVTSTVACDVKNGVTPLHVQLEPCVARAVHVFDDQGRPVAGARVELLAGDGDIDPTLERELRLGGRITHRSMAPDANRAAPVTIAAIGITDRSGKVVLEAPGSDTQVRVRAFTEAVLPTPQPLPSWKPGREALIVRAPAAARCTGRIEPAAALAALDASTEKEREDIRRFGTGTNPWRKSLADLRRSHGATLALRDKATGAVLPGTETVPADDGTFRIGPAPAGRFDVVLVVPRREGQRVQRSVHEEALATVDLRAGESTEVTLRVPELAPPEGAGERRKR